jgi:hypothetical protein
MEQPFQGGEHKNNIPDLHANYHGDGYEWIEHLPAGWEAVSSWGRDGWDLGAWPLAVVATYENSETGRYAYGVYTEGDVHVTQVETHGDLYAAVDGIAEWYWRNKYALGPPDLPEGRGLLDHHRRPFTWWRPDTDGDRGSADQHQGGTK